MKTLIAIPTVKTVQVEFMKCLLALKSPAGCDISVIDQAAIHAAREMAAMCMARGGYDSLLFIDSDMTFPPDLLLQLQRHRAPVVSGMCFKRIPPYTPCFYKSMRYDEKKQLVLEPFDLDGRPEKPFTAAAVGAACLLIQAEVFTKIKYPWFLPLPMVGEDIAFCLRLQQAGIPILIDPGPEIGHLETRPAGLNEYIRYKQEAAHD